ncbi:DUF4445 domain-containing protein [Candidatus Sumerlaeota bacterium]|nr:DUF4445 domain-containing protein [Candidatus Sumerlaeota bacterium]
MKLTLLPVNKCIDFEQPKPLKFFADTGIEYQCGANGKCGKCRVRFVEGAPEPSTADTNLFSPTEIEQGWRLACTALLTRDATIEIPSTTATVEMTQHADSDTATHRTGIAIDIGSTSIYAILADLDSQKALSTMTLLNMQTLIAADVMSRVQFAMTNANGNDILHKTLRDEINSICANLCEQAHISPDIIEVVTAVGNPVMLHTFVGSDIRPFGTAPYEGQWTDTRTESARDIGLTALPNAMVHMLPQIRHIVGADTTAAIFATNMDTRDETILLIDLGTNCEIALSTGGELRATSTAAGPAFEGTNITCGMRATRGAISSVFLTRDNSIDITVIGGGEPVGICGTGLADAIAILLNMGAITGAGRLLPNDLSPVPQIIGVDKKSNKPCAHLTDKVFITADDVRNLQLVKAAVRAGAEMLLDDAGITWTDINHIFLAGAFGQAVNPRSIARIQMLPLNTIPVTRAIGNAAATGALKALLAWDQSLPRLNDIHRRIKYVDCVRNEDFQEQFANAMSFAK